MTKGESAKLHKIIEQNAYIIKLLENIVDDANLVSQLQRQVAKSRDIIRQLEYEKWFNEKQKQTKTWKNTSTQPNWPTSANT